ncbi:uncharacterized protein LOC114362304 [Ostrinia furnacalis]|uniref:uncharacterized protein LOC114362304 n=1 Tax=Ostrinia furnacalis TaxID=93504 RepID=UPI00103D40AE|nr:uncharacterized protein LOC114362304 [Ostrinia furnacalis]
MTGIALRGGATLAAREPRQRQRQRLQPTEARPARVHVDAQCQRAPAGPPRGPPHARAAGGHQCGRSVAPHSFISISGCSRQKRGWLVSTWVRSASAPPLAPHVAPHTRALLGAIGMAAPHLSRSEGEVEELLSRAMVIMCIESAATAALSVSFFS